MSDYKLWYTRRGEVVRGPFPPGQIRRFLLLGRILPNDELSVDQRTWSPAHSHADLYPEELNADPADPAAMERLRLARMREDERIRDRRQQQRYEADNAAVRGGSDRRRAEDQTTVASREQRDRVILRPAPGRSGVRLVAVLAGLLFCAVVVLAYRLAPPSTGGNFLCAQAPVPGVNWSNCRKSGEDLSGVDLRNAQIVNSYFDGSRLQGADFSGGNLDYSSFNAADLGGARFDGASLKGAVLRGAKLERTSMTSAHLQYAILQKAVLHAVNLENADLRNSDFQAAELSEVNLRGADLSGAIWTDGSRCQASSLGACRH